MDSRSINMVKTITIRDEVYRKLTAIKRTDESFSDLFDRLARRQGTLAEIVALRGAISFESQEDRRSFLELVGRKRGERRE